MGRFGFDGELMIGASATAGWTLSGFCVGVVKNEEVGPAHVLSVVVDLGFSEASLKVSKRYEEFAVVRNH